MEVMPGYKQTEVGVIPKEWDVIRLSELTSEIGDGIHSTPEYVKSSAYYFINGNNLVDGTILIADTTMCVSEAEWQKLRKDLSGQTILMSINGTIGNLAFYRGERVVLGKSAAYLNIASGISKEYVLYSLSASSTSKYFENELTGTTIRNLSLVSLRNTPIPIPREMEEQRAIARALGDVDALIAALENLVTKKRDLKQAAMHKLLTGQQRLPGFSGEWEVRFLCELCNLETGRRPKGGVTEEGDVPSLGGENVRNDNGLNVATVKKVPESFFLSMTKGVLRERDVLINKDGANTGKVAFYVGAGFKRACINEHLFIMRGGSALDNGFLYYLLCLPATRKEVDKQIASSAQPGLNRKFLDVVSIRTPGVEEQTAIATVLSDMDAELAALEARLAKTRVLKQGMMQELLTGRTRLVSSTTIVSRKEKARTASETKSHNWQINEAVVISVLVKQFGSEKFPLGRKRYTKLSYLLHRHVEKKAEGYLKKAAGPYNPSMKYKGPEDIAQQNGYIRTHTSGQLLGFVAAHNIAKAEAYFQKWYGSNALEWLEQFRYEKKEAIELLTTIDMAIQDLRANGKEISVENVKEVLRADPEWRPKLMREIFSDAKIRWAIAKCQDLFG